MERGAIERTAFGGRLILKSGPKGREVVLVALVEGLVGYKIVDRFTAPVIKFTLRNFLIG